MSLYTELDIVNRGLGLLGQLPVNEISTPHPMVPAILLHLGTSNKDVQAREWWFNTEKVTLSPQTDKRILVPNDTVSIDAVDTRVRVTQRGRYLFNPITSSYEFDGPIDVQIHRLVPFAELPATAQRYVGTQALMRVQASIDGDGPRYRDLATENQEAWFAITSEDTRNRGANLLRRSRAQGALYRINQNSPFPYRR